MSYALGWLGQAENQYLAVPPEVARSLPEQLQRLVGYAIHVPNLGWYEGQDPSVVLGSGKSDTLAVRDYMPPELELSLKEHYEFGRASWQRGAGPTHGGGDFLVRLRWTGGR